MSYVKLMEEIDFYAPKGNFEAINAVLKEIHKHLKTLTLLKEKGLQIFSIPDAKTLLERL